jgi:hydrogenase assembly chaperone HypC/HupF
MCLPLVGRIVLVDAEQAEIELLGDGRRASAGLALFPEAAAGQHVLIDRGLVIELIEAEEATALLAFYAELAASLDPEPDVVEAGDG